MREIIFSSGASLFNCLRRNIGVAFCPEVAVAEDLRAGRLVRLAWPAGPDATTAFVIRHADKWVSPSVRRFMDLVLEMVRPGARGGR